MTDTGDRQPFPFPPALAAALAAPFDYADGEGVDFEPFPAFLSADGTTEWFRAWTGNADVNGDDFRVFGQHGAGGYAALWRTRPNRPLEEQPVVFLGSEGETAVIASDLNAFLWLLAAGYGPWEAATSDDPDWAPRPNPELGSIAARFASAHQQPAADIIEQAAQEFADFDDTMMRLCR